jgi:hypothetical protein
VTERYNANFFEVLIGQVAEDGEIDIVLSKVVSVLGHADLLKPIRNLLHRGGTLELLSAPRLDAVSLSNKGLQCDAFGRPVSQVVSDVLIMSWHFRFAPIPGLLMSHSK